MTNLYSRIKAVNNFDNFKKEIEEVSRLANMRAKDEAMRTIEEHYGGN